MRNGEPARVLVIGESLIDALPEREVVGGSPANVAIGLGRLAVPVRLHTALGADDRGRRIATHLEGSGVELTADSWSLSQTSVAHVALDATGAPTYRFEIDTALAPWQYRGEAIVHVGSISAFLEPGAQHIVRFIESLPQGVTVTFDPNIRAALIDDPAGVRARFKRLCVRADVVKLSDEDAAWLYPSREVTDVMTQIAALGPKIVALTRGEEGAVMLSQGVTHDIPSSKVPVVDTVGAGDTFMAALISRLVNDFPVTKPEVSRAGAFAAAAAGITVQRQGADLPWLQELNA